MSYKVVGMKHSTGTYEGNAYDNTLVYCTYEDSKVSGVGTIVHKLKTSAFNTCPCKLGEQIEVMYDRYGNVTQLYKG